MLNGTASKVDGLLSEIASLYEADTEGVGHGLGTLSGQDREKDEETIFLIQQAQEGKETAYGLLKDKYADLVWSQIRKHEHKIMDLPDDLREDLNNVIWQYVFKIIKRFDGKLAKFSTWVTGIAKKIASRHLPRLLDKERRHGQLTRISPDMEKHLKAKDEPHNEFTTDEKQLAKELIKHLDDLKAGTVRFPIRPKPIEGESPEEAAKRVREMYVDVFQSYFGLGVPRLNSPDLVKKYAHHPVPVTKANLANWYLKRFRLILQNWAQEQGKGALYANLLNKLDKKKGTRSTPHPVLEDYLFGLLNILETWNEPAYA